MLGEVMGGYKGSDMSLLSLQVVVVVSLDRGVLDRGAVHSFGLAVGPRVIGLGQPVFDAVGDVDAVEGMRSQEAPTRALAVLGQVGEGHAVVGEHGVDLVGEAFDHRPQKGGSLYLSRAVLELDVGEF